MAKDAEPARKRRDNLELSLRPPLYTEEPLPPFIFTVLNMLYVCFEVDPARAQAILPAGLTLADGAAGMIAFFDTAAEGWGLNAMSCGFIALLVNEYPAPDTSESGYIPSFYANEPGRTRLRRHWCPAHLGRCEMRHDGKDHWAVLFDGEDRVVAECQIRQAGDVVPTFAHDCYVSLDRSGDLFRWTTSIIGDVGGAEALSLRFTEDADPAWQAMQPTGLEWAMYAPSFVANWAGPEPLQTFDPKETMKASREALMDILDGQGRACAILSVDAKVLHANGAARRLLNRLQGMGPVHLGPDQPRFRAALAAAAQGQALTVDSPFLRPDTAGAPLILQVAPIDPLLAGPGTALLLIDDPAFKRRAPRAELLQLLGLTPGEARIASTVGAGLPPREAAARLGLAESTVRSSLKVIFDKLGVNRQAELVQLVGRLDPG